METLSAKRYYSFAVVFFEASLNSRRRIFPDAFLGIASTNTTPPLNCL